MLLLLLGNAVLIIGKEKFQNTMASVYNCNSLLISDQPNVMSLTSEYLPEC
jgi:hypothetical protein